MRTELTEIEWIELYLEGKMNAEEKKSFEAKMNNDKDFKQKVLFQESFMQRMETVVLMQSLKEAHTHFTSGSGGSTASGSSNWLGSALKVMVIGVVSITTLVLGYKYFMNGETEAKTSKLIAPSGHMDDTYTTVLEEDSIENDFTISGEEHFYVENPVLSNYINKSRNRKQVYMLDSDKDTLLVCKDGTAIHVKAQSFKYKSSGTPYSGKVSFKIAEYYELEDIVKANLTTTSGKEMIETGGMLHILAYAQNGHEELALNQSLQVEMPTDIKKSGMQLFYGEEKHDLVDWEVAINSMDLNGSFKDISMTTSSSNNKEMKMERSNGDSMNSLMDGLSIFRSIKEIKSKFYEITIFIQNRYRCHYVYLSEMPNQYSNIFEKESNDAIFKFDGNRILFKWKDPLYSKSTFLKYIIECDSIPNLNEFSGYLTVTVEGTPFDIPITNKDQSWVDKQVEDFKLQNQIDLIRSNINKLEYFEQNVACNNCKEVWRTQIQKENEGFLASLFTKKDFNYQINFMIDEEGNPKNIKLRAKNMANEKVERYIEKLIKEMQYTPKIVEGAIFEEKVTMVWQFRTRDDSKFAYSIIPTIPRDLKSVEAGDGNKEAGSTSDITANDVTGEPTSFEDFQNNFVNVANNLNGWKEELKKAQAKLDSLVFSDEKITTNSGGSPVTSNNGSYYSDATAYVFQVSKLGWINCDRFTRTPKNLIANLTIVADDDFDQCSIIFNDISSVMNGFKALNESDRQYEFAKIPKGKSITIMAKKHVGEEVHFAFADAEVVNGELKPQLSFESYSYKALGKKLREIKESSKAWNKKRNS